TQMALVHQSLLRDFERNSQDNGYFLNEIARRYKNRDTANLGAIANAPDRIKMLTAADVYEAAQNYLDTDRYVKVILMPERSHGQRCEPCPVAPLRPLPEGEGRSGWRRAKRRRPSPSGRGRSRATGEGSQCLPPVGP